MHTIAQRRFSSSLNASGVPPCAVERGTTVPLKPLLWGGTWLRASGGRSALRAAAVAARTSSSGGNALSEAQSKTRAHCKCCSVNKRTAPRLRRFIPFASRYRRTTRRKRAIRGPPRNLADYAARTLCLSDSALGYSRVRFTTCLLETARHATYGRAQPTPIGGTTLCP